MSKSFPLLKLLVFTLAFKTIIWLRFLCGESICLFIYSYIQIDIIGIDIHLTYRIHVCMCRLYDERSVGSLDQLLLMLAPLLYSSAISSFQGYSRLGECVYFESHYFLSLSFLVQGKPRLKIDTRLPFPSFPSSRADVTPGLPLSLSLSFRFVHFTLKL